MYCEQEWMCLISPGLIKKNLYKVRIILSGSALQFCCFSLFSPQDQDMFLLKLSKNNNAHMHRYTNIHTIWDKHGSHKRVLCSGVMTINIQTYKSARQHKAFYDKTNITLSVKSPWLWRLFCLIRRKKSNSHSLIFTTSPQQNKYPCSTYILSLSA